MNSKIWLATLGVPVLLAAQDIPIDIFSSLAPKASQAVQVNLDSSMLQMAARFLNDKTPDEAKVKNLVTGLNGVYVRSFTFDKPGEYSTADVEKIRAQLKGWKEVVSVRGPKETTGIYLKSDGQKIQGLVVIAAEAQQLTLVNIVGAIQPEQLKDLSGKFGIPDLGGIEQKAGQKKKE